MRNLLRIILFLLIASPAFAQPEKDKVVNLHGKKFYQHIVLKGETVYGISRDFRLSPKDIVLENPKAIDGINPGDTLHIPVFVPGPVPPENVVKKMAADSTEGGKYIFHKVEPKETLYSMTKQYGVSAAVLDSLNPMLKDKGLRAGMTLRIPNKNATATNITTQPQTGKKDTATQVQAFKNLVNGDTTHHIVEGKLFNRYNIALILTFSSQEVDSVKMNRMLDGAQQFPLPAVISSDFYAGVKMALDSLAKQGLNVNLHVYNIPLDSATRRIDSLLRLPAMASMNLIIGPLYPMFFHRVAKYAMQHQIPVVSPLSSESGLIKDNPFTSKAVPSSTTEMEQMADYIAAHHHGDNIIIVHNDATANDNYFDTFKKRLNASLSIAGNKNDSAIVVKYSDDLNGLGHTISDKKYNVLVVPYQGASFVPKLINQLTNSKYTDDDSICVFGMQNWATMDVLDPNNLDTLHLHYPSNEYIDYANHSVVVFIQKYRATYMAEPTYFAYQGFDIAYYYCTALKKYGTALQDNLVNEKYKGFHTSFDFYKPDPTGGLENKAIYMLEFKNYSVVKDNL